MSLSSLRKSHATLVHQWHGFNRCRECGEGISHFEQQRKGPPKRGWCVVANRYVRGRWVEVVWFHVGCYRDQFGVAEKSAGNARQRWAA